MQDNQNMTPINHRPLVSIYIPTHNRLSLLKRAIKSVQSQNYSNLEIIVVDDFSSDGTKEFLFQESQVDSRLKFYIMPNNVGACVCRNKAIEMAKGEYITGLDDDDYFLSHRISEFINFTKPSEDVICLFSTPFFKTSRKGLVAHKVRDFFLRKKINHKDLIFNNYIGNQIFVRTEDFRRTGAFDPQMPMWQDLEAFYNLLVTTKKYALNIGAYSYVQDVSHDGDRISHLHNKKSEKAIAHFVNKHQLSKSDQKILYSHLYKYDDSLIDISILCIKIFNKWDINDIYLLLKTVFKKISRLRFLKFLKRSK